MTLPQSTSREVLRSSMIAVNELIKPMGNRKIFVAHADSHEEVPDYGIYEETLRMIDDTMKGKSSEIQ